MTSRSAKLRQWCPKTERKVTRPIGLKLTSGFVKFDGLLNGQP